MTVAAWGLLAVAAAAHALTIGEPFDYSVAVFIGRPLLAAAIALGPLAAWAIGYWLVRKRRPPRLGFVWGGLALGVFIVLEILERAWA